MIASQQNIPIRTKYSKQFMNNLLEIVLDINNQVFRYDINIKNFSNMKIHSLFFYLFLPLNKKLKGL